LPAEVKYGSLPFDEAIDFLRGKVNIPTEHWDDLWQGMHARGFMVAGAAKTELLSDFRSAVDKVISKGTTLEDFRKDFDRIVETHGWSYKGGRNWRTEVIFSTNIRTAYAAGRYKQMTDPDVLAYRPYWQYRHGASRVPRPLHLSWDGLVLPSDDPWWDDHYPPKGWGCSCRVFPLSDRDMAKQGKDGFDQAPDNGTYEWVDRNDVVHEIPNGVDPGWNYNVGKAAYGQRLSEEAMSSWRAEGAKAYETLTGGNWESEQRPQAIPMDPSAAKMGERSKNRPEAEAALREILGGDEKIFSFQPGDFRYDTLVNAKTLSSHVDLSRSSFLPFLSETMTDPYEVWIAFEQHKGTGQVVLRQRVVKGIDVGDGKGMLFVANSTKGVLEGWTFFPIGNLAYLNDQRYGKLIWKR
jgi:hypothetical protein